MKRWMARWFPAVWPATAQRLRVAAEYAAMRDHRLMLADIAMRNFVFAAAPDAASLFDAGIAEGRRRAALEIFDAMRVDPQEIGALEVLILPRDRGDAAGEDDAGSGNAASWEQWRQRRAAK